MNESDLNDAIPCQPWSTRISKMAQPNLDYIGKFTKIAFQIKFNKIKLN